MAIAINYLDRLTLPSVIDQMPKEMALDKQSFALLNTAFLAAYGAMYLVGGKLLDLLGTRKGFSIIIVFWSLACATHGFANGLIMLVICRLLLGIGEGGGFPAATRAVAEWFPVKERSTAMGIINGATGVGGMVAIPLIWVLLNYTGWFGIASWRWVFFITGGAGLLWLMWWLLDYFVPDRHPGLSEKERQYIQGGMPAAVSAPAAGDNTLNYASQPVPPELPAERKVPLAVLFQHKETWGIVVAKFLTDAAWYFILFWLPTFLNALHKRLYPQEVNYNFSKTAEVAWIPHAGAFAGCLIGGSLSSWLLRRNYSVNFSRKVALFASAIIMPLLILVPYFDNVAIVIALLTAGYFGQQSWSTLVMVLPTDLFPKRTLGTVAGLVGLGGALGGAVLGQFASYLLDHGSDYRPVMLIAGLLHVTAFGVIMITVPNMRPLVFAAKARAHDSLLLVLKLQLPALAIMLLGTIVVSIVMGGMSAASNATSATAPLVVNYSPMILTAIACLVVFMSILAAASLGKALPGMAAACILLTGAAAAWKFYFIFDANKWGKDHAFASCCIAASLFADVILSVTAASFVIKRSSAAESELEEKVLA
ncbi:MAG TPA: MFS transporter [Phycisphaerae bacterium]|nr:MFS transporter [Phycisphaerae bacterium]